MEHLPEWGRGAFDDPRLELHHEDAYAYLARSSEPFDVVILDLVDPTEAGPASRLYAQEFYRLAASRLTAQGTLVTQGGPALAGVVNGSHGLPAGPRHARFEGQVLTDTARAFPTIAHTLATVFPLVACYSATVPAFGGPWGFVLASKGTDDPTQWMPEEVDRRLAARVRGNLRYHDGLTHRGMFSLPKPLRQALARETWVITEDRPLYVP